MQHRTKWNKWRWKAMSYEQNQLITLSSLSNLFATQKLFTICCNVAEWCIMNDIIAHCRRNSTTVKSWKSHITCPMLTSSNGNMFHVTGLLCGGFTGLGEFPTQRPVTRSFDVFFDLRLNKRWSKQPWGRWFETPSWSLWRQRNALFRGIHRLSVDSMHKGSVMWKVFPC